MNLSTIKKYFQALDDSIVIGLRGKIKGEANERDHLFYCVNITSSGIKTQEWIKLLITVHSKAGRHGSPGITTWRGKMLKSADLDEKLHYFLGRMFEEGNKFPIEISSMEDIIERFSIYRSLRRASDTRALERKVAATDIDIVNRWKAVEMGKGSRPGRVMRQHYAEPSRLKAPFLRYTFAM